MERIRLASSSRSGSSLPNPRPSRLPRGLAAFRHRNYRLYFMGQLVSTTGTWMQMLAQSWLVLTLTSSPLLLGLVNVFQFTPILLLGLVGGVVADRLPKRNLLLVTQSVAGVLAATLAVLVATDNVQLWHVYALAMGLGIANAFDMPARHAFVVEMVGKDDLLNAVALNSAVFNAARLVGPALAGLILATVGIAACFGINAVSYLAVIAGLLMMRIERRASAVARGPGQLREGLAYVRGTPAVLLPIVLIGFVATFAMNFNVWIPLLAKKEFAVGAGGFGVLMAALGAGSLLGALTLAFVGRKPRQGWMLATAGAFGVFELLLAVAGAIPVPLAVALAVLPLMGFCSTATMSLGNLLVQTATPDGIRGRVMSVHMTVFAGTAPFGALLAGASAKVFGTPASIAIGGFVTVAVAITAGVLTGVIRRPARATTPAGSPPASLPDHLPTESQSGSRSTISASSHD